MSQEQGFRVVEKLPLRRCHPEGSNRVTSLTSAFWLALEPVWVAYSRSNDLLNGVAFVSGPSSLERLFCSPIAKIEPRSPAPMFFLHLQDGRPLPFQELANFFAGNAMHLDQPLQIT